VGDFSEITFNAKLHSNSIHKESLLPLFIHISYLIHRLLFVAYVYVIFALLLFAIIFVLCYVI